MVVVLWNIIKTLIGNIPGLMGLFVARRRWSWSDDNAVRWWMVWSWSSCKGQGSAFEGLKWEVLYLYLLKPGASFLG
jgi:hypothetical protein